MSIPNLIKSILSIHDLQTKVNELSTKLEAVNDNHCNRLLAIEKSLNLALEEIKDLQSEAEKYITKQELEEHVSDYQTADEVETLIEEAVDKLDLSEEVSNCIENLNISIKVC